MAKVEVKFGRFAMRSKARKRIERVTDGCSAFEGTWLVIDGVIRKRSEPVTAVELARAYVRLGWGPLDGTARDAFSATPYSCLVSYQATSKDIETGWDIVADLVCAEVWT